MSSLPQLPDKNTEALKPFCGEIHNNSQRLLISEVSTAKGVRELGGSVTGQKADAMLEVSEMKHLQERAKPEV